MSQAFRNVPRSRLIVHRPSLSVAVNVEPGETLIPHLYDLSFNGVNQYAVVGLQPGNWGTPFTVYGWSEITVEELIRVDDRRVAPRKAGMIGDIWNDHPCILNTRIMYPPYGIMARADARRPDGTRYTVQVDVSQWVENAFTHLVKVLTLTPSKRFTVYANGNSIYSVSIPSDYVTVLEWNPDTATYPERYKRFVLGANTLFGEHMTVRYGYVRIYSRALTEEEISNAMRGVVNASGLRLFIDPTFFDGTKYVDLSGNGNHAYPYNKPSRVPAESCFVWRVKGGGSKAKVLIPPMCRYKFGGGAWVTNDSWNVLEVEVSPGMVYIAFEGVEQI